MSQVLTIQKRRWLKRILGGCTPKALWMAPALLTPVFMAAAPDVALGQAPAASQTIQDTSKAIDDQFVLDWLNYAAVNAKDLNKAAQGFTEALRGRKIMHLQEKKLDPRVEGRLKDVEATLKRAGLTMRHVEDAANKLKSNAIKPAPKMAALTQTPNLPSPVVPASSVSGGPTAQVAPAMQLPGAAGPQVTQGVYWPGQDGTANSAASGQVSAATPILSGASGEELYQRGLEQLTSGDRQGAYDLFRQAWRFEREMDITIRAQLKDKLTSMQPRSAPSGPERVSPSPIQQASQAQLLARQKWMSEVSGEISAAEANREAEPQVVAERLQTLRTRVSQAELDGQTRKQMLTLVDRQIATHQIYMTQNKSAIEQTMRNQQVTEQRSLDQQQIYKTEQQIASLVDSYNDLMDEGRYYEAEQVAKQVGALDRDSVIAASMIINSRNGRRIRESEEIHLAKEDGFIDVLNDVDRSSIPLPDREGMTFPDQKEWAELTERRARLVEDQNRGMSPADAAVYERLKSPVLVDFKNRPLSEVVDVLQNLTGIPIHIDEVAIEREGLGSPSEIAISLSLQSEIQLRSALNIMLTSHGLSYQVRDEVLYISSASDDSKANIERVYNVKDLVIPIPNFVHDNNSGMAGAVRHAYETVAAGRGLMAQAERGNTALPVHYAGQNIAPGTNALGQLNFGAGGGLPPGLGRGLMGSGGGPTMGSPSPMNMGSPGPIGGGAAQADFDTLMNLIQQTIVPDSWLANGGSSNILPYPSNLSLVISAPQTTHEKVAELLESLRRLQDLQVTIEVKFITLSDTFFERMGIDFDVKIDDNVSALPNDDSGPSASVGLNASVNPFTGALPVTGDLDITLSQNTFGSAVPPFGNFDASSGASLGFAILSDLEMFFFMNAAQGDQRTNVLQAPRVTMFDGQFASINDTIQRPFVTSLIPVVGDFAVAQQPVIVVLNEGTVLNVQATVSPDKRFVRLTLNPNFSQIDRVDTFTFEGSTTTRSGSNVLDANGNLTGTTDDNEQVVTGTTVQQPSFASTSISTTVSVPDGGTILLGGIKRMREGRIERGVPILSKIPYVNRLFKNTAIGRETSTLMMTVTPRIIIQEEEEAKYGVSP
ncbi:MAG: type II secretion system protein GspD [Pirellulaceae bacterium]